MAQINIGKGTGLSVVPKQSGGGARTPVNESGGLYVPREIRAHTTLVYGRFGTLKSWMALKFAEYMLKRTGKITRYVYSDLGGYEDIKTAADAGLIEVTNLGHNKSSMAAIYKLARGEWPEKVGESGEIYSYRSWNQSDSDRIGAYVFDGLTSICSRAMAEMVESGRKVSEDVVGAFEVFAENFGLVSRGHYNQSQHLAKNFLRMIAELPVERVYITALESSGMDEAKEMVYGPEVAGKALTEKIPSDLGDTLHSFKDDKTQEIRLYFGYHKHPQAGKEMITNIRLSGDKRVGWIEKYPQGYYQIGDDAGGRSVVEFLECQDSASGSNKESWKEMVERYKKDSNDTKPIATTEANINL